MYAVLRSGTRWLALSTLVAAVAFGLLTFGQVTLATYAGLAAAILYTAAGGRLSRGLGQPAEEERINYPFAAAQRGRRLAYVSLAATIGIAGYTFAAPFVFALLGPTGLIVAGAAAFLAPPFVVMLAIWTTDGISLRSGLEAPGDPLVGATLGLGLALILAVIGATTQYDPSFVLLAAFGGLVPSVFTLWSLARLDKALDQVHARRSRPAA